MQDKPKDQIVGTIEWFERLKLESIERQKRWDQEDFDSMSDDQLKRFEQNWSRYE
jgi:hypothetical protein